MGLGTFPREELIEDNYVVYPYFPCDADEETLFAQLAHEAEVTFFCEGGDGFLHLRTKAQEAANAGDLETLCLLAEGFGYWRGATEAHQRAAAEYQARTPRPRRRAPRTARAVFVFRQAGRSADDPCRLARAAAPRPCGAGFFHSGAIPAHGEEPDEDAPEL